MNTTPPRRRRRWPLRLLIAVALLAGLYLTRVPSLTAVAGFLDVGEPPGPVDAVMVLGGGSNTRPVVAAALVRAGLARRVLVPTVRLAPENEDGLTPPDHELIRRVLRARGVPDQAIVNLPGEVNSTRDEARSLHRYLDTEPDATVTVVTNGFHTRRTRMLFCHELGERAAQVHFVAAPTDGFSTHDWWRHEAGFNTYAAEYFKLVYYGLREDRLWQGTVLSVVALAVVIVLVRRRRRRSPTPPVASVVGGSAAPSARA
jgi:uncharacterized SAM-binding protein YcdF (DUF218 family)